MSDSIFRQSALDQLASPERLDAPLALVGRASWLLLGAVAAGLVGALIWAVLTTSPVKVSGAGVLIGERGLSEVAGDEGGLVRRVLVTSGQMVHAGDPIAELTRTDLQRDLDDAGARLAAARQRYQAMAAFYAGEQARDRGTDALRLDTLSQTRAALADRVRYLSDKAVRMRQLVDRGFVQKDRLADVQVELADARERLANLGESAARVQSDANTKSGQERLALLDQQREISEQERRIARLGAQLGERRYIRAREDGQITEIKAGGGDVIGSGTAIATLAPVSRSGRMIALLYVPVAEGKRIQPGMAAEISPANVERAIFGHIPGRILSVAPLPSTAEGMRKMLRNDTLVRQLLSNGAPIEIRVALDTDAANPSGYRWSASHGPAAALSAGVTLTGDMIVERKRIIGLLVPQVAN